MQTMEEILTSAARTRAIAILICVTLLWGISFPLMKVTNRLVERQLGVELIAEDGAEGTHTPANTRLQVASASYFMTVRYVISTVLLACMLPGLFRGLTRYEFMAGFWTGAVFGVGNLLQVIGLNTIPASRSGFLTCLTVIFTPVTMILLERRLPRFFVTVGACLAILGMAILTGLLPIGWIFGLTQAAEAPQPLGIGDILTTLGAVIFTAQILMVDYYATKISTSRLTPGMFAAVILMSVAVFAWCEFSYAEVPAIGRWTELLSGRFVILTFIASLFCTVMTFHWMNKYQPAVSPDHAALIYTLEPLFATGWAMILPPILAEFTGIAYPGETLTYALQVGGGFVVAGNLLALKKPKGTETVKSAEMQ